MENFPEQVTRRLDGRRGYGCSGPGLGRSGEGPGKGLRPRCKGCETMKEMALTELGNLS